MSPEEVSASARMVGGQNFPLHFMTTMLAAVLAYTPLLVSNAGFQLSVAAVFGILLLRKLLKSLVERTLLKSLSRADRSPSRTSLRSRWRPRPPPPR